MQYSYSKSSDISATAAQLWETCAKELQAVYRPALLGLGAGRVEAKLDRWTVVLDDDPHNITKLLEHPSVTTRIRSVFIAKSKFRFVIDKGSGWYVTRKQAEEPGQPLWGPYPEIQSEFYVDGTDPEKLREILLDQRIRNLIVALPKLLIEIKDSELVFVYSGPELILNIDALKALFELFRLILTRLVEVGLVTNEDPNCAL